MAFGQYLPLISWEPSRAADSAEGQPREPEPARGVCEVSMEPFLNRERGAPELAGN